MKALPASFREGLAFIEFNSIIDRYFSNFGIILQKNIKLIEVPFLYYRSNYFQHLCLISTLLVEALYSVSFHFHFISFLVIFSQPYFKVFITHLLWLRKTRWITRSLILPSLIDSLNFYRKVYVTSIPQVKRTLYVTFG